ncbi:C-type lectin domain family 10 member A-like [Salarias fasciatus]|uniref:C-type lectin domain family 10 member A-like n=1 Tax=Salarias fasciatus TaxID=181472 RepID=A0A672HVZ5_SALFA|nr:C-type lectin domain family 10 member A-like [Salarias fasciatus]
MQELEMVDYDNDGPGRRERPRGHKDKPERRLFMPLFLGFGVLCIIQGILNISLRVAYYSSKTSACNLTHVGGKPTTAPKVAVDCQEMKNRQCNKLQERFNALTADKNLLENTNNILNNRIKELEEEVQRLQMNTMDMSGCTSSQRCPTGWREINSRCYFLSTEMKTWQNSRRHCQSENADLVVISSPEEQRAIYRLDGEAYLLFWIGLQGTDGNFRWVDGSALTNQFWQVGQPDHGGPNNVEDCVEMYHHNPLLTSWNDAPCGQRRRWMCEKEPCQVSGALT